MPESVVSGSILQEYREEYGMRRQKSSLWIQILFLIGIAGGTFVGIWMRDWLTEQISVGQSLFALQAVWSDLADRKYLFWLLRRRLPQIAVLFFVVYAGWYMKILIAFSFCAGFWVGIGMTGMTLLYGIEGVVQFTAGIFPQIPIYGLGFLLLYEFSYKRIRFRKIEQIKIAAQIFLVFGVGVMCEWGIQPILLKLAGFY